MSLHNPGFVVPMPVILELSTSVCAYVCMCKEGALDGLDIFLKKNQNIQKKQPTTPQMRLFVHASSKLQSRSLRFCCFFSI